MPIIQGHILDGSTINTDGWKAYDGLILNGYEHHSSLSQSRWIWYEEMTYGIENLMWILQKGERAKFNGCTSEAFVLPLEQDKFTNHRNDEKL